MTPTSFGNITLSEYRQLAGRRTRLSRYAKLVGVLVAALLLTAAGDWIGLWTGKHTQTVSLEDALRLLEDSGSEQWRTEAGMGIAFRHAERAIACLREVAIADGKNGLYAGLYLRNTAKDCIRAISELAQAGVRVEEMREHLEHLEGLAKSR